MVWFLVLVCAGALGVQLRYHNAAEKYLLECRLKHVK